jgi:hypothetical protein
MNIPMDAERIKHLEMIQAIITRMNTNSFQLKGLSITIVAAILAIYAATQKVDFILIAIFPLIIFWFLDTYYLQMERKFRGLYNDVAGVTDDPQTIQLFEMRPDLYTGGKYIYLRILFSKTIWPVYLPIIAILIGIFIYLKHF